MVSVPQINDRGDAALTFPIILPQGRHGMTPDISVNYNSSSDEGDFGVGWSLSVPTISVDTRWGVPTYDSSRETESYLLNGEELLLVQANDEMYAPHKSPLISRVNEAIFQKAQHNPNQEIKRLGTVTNYSWEVLDRSTGWTYYYSTYSKGKWYLSKVEDTFKNNMQYYYNQNSSGDYQLKRIVYNDNPQLFDVRSQFTILINRKQTIDLPYSSRLDVKTSNRYGVEEKSLDLIDNIIIETTPKPEYYVEEYNQYLGNVFNEYKFIYKAGKFGRSLLTKIINKNANNNTILGNSQAPGHNPIIEEYNFDYYDDIGDGPLFESQGKTINTYNDYETGYERLNVRVSALGGGEGRSTNFNGGGSLGVVTPFFPDSWLPFSKAATFGKTFGGGSSNSETKVMMADIDGDGLPDKIFKDGDKFYYRKNLGNKFSSEVFSIKNLPNLSYTKGDSSDNNTVINILAGNLTRSKSKSTSKTSTYMTDVNADGLLDVVDNERVYFGYINPQTKEPNFNLDSSITPAIVLKEEDVAPVLNPIPQVDLTNGPMDVVMVWRAPKPGQVRVNGVINKQHVSLENGLKFSIEKLHENDLGSAQFILGPNLMLSTSESHNNTLNVIKGDLLFFRVHTNQIPIEELGVKWNPKVEYIGVNPDPIIASSRHSSSYSEGFIVGSNQERTFNKKGRYRLEWPSFSVYDQDRVTIRVSYFKKGTNAGGNVPILNNNIIINEQTSGIQTYSSFTSPNLVLDMNSITSVPSSFHYLKIEVLSDSEIDWKDIDTQFKPKLVSLTNENEDIYLIPSYTNYSKVHTSNNPMTFTGSGSNVKLIINNNFTLPSCTQLVCNDRYVYMVSRFDNGSIVGIINTSTGAPMGYMKFRYKFDANGNIIQKQRLNENYQYVNLNNTYELSLNNRYVGEKFFFEYYTTEHKIGELLDNYQNSTPTPLIKVTSSGANPSTFISGVDPINGKVKANVYTSEETPVFGPMYRNWGQFAYKGADVGSPYEAIEGKNIKISYSSSINGSGDTVEDVLEDRNLTLDQLDLQMDDIEQLGGNISEYFSMLLPNKKTNRWESHEHLYVSDRAISPYTRFLTDDIPDLRPPSVPVGNFGAFGINKYSYFSNTSTNLSAGFGPLTVGRASAKGTSELLNEFMDINGDGFPDIIGERIQLTAKRGGLSNKIIDADFTIRTSILGSGALAGGATAGMKNAPPPSGKRTNNLIVGNQASGALSGNYFDTTNTTTRFYTDINGDGLIDIVQNNGKVFLNYGGVFRESTVWRSLPVQKSNTETWGISGGLGFSMISNLDISAGLGGSSNKSIDEVSYIDLNGDGLPEKVIDNNFYINTGTGFESISHTMPGRQTQKSSDVGMNGNVTLCVYFPAPIIFTGPKICFSFGASEGRNVTSEEGRFMDFDGDGFVDYVTSNKNESMTVYYSKIKRTNLLKTVTQSTGSTINLDYDVVNPIEKTVIGSTYKMPYKKWALTKVSVYDDFEGDGENTTRYLYEYFNGYKDRKQRSFFGFGMTKAHLLNVDGYPYRTTVAEYLINEMKENELYSPGISSDLKKFIYKKGLPRRSYTLDKRQRKLSETSYEYKFYNSRLLTANINTQGQSNTEVAVFTEKLSVLPLVTAINTENWNYRDESSNSALVYRTQQRFLNYDRFGNVIKYQDVDRNLNVEIDYNYGLKTLPIEHIVVDASSNEILRKSSATVAPNNVKYESVTKYSDLNHSITTEFEYDDLGNIINKILPGGLTYTYYYGSFDYHFNHGDYFKILPGIIRDPFGNETRTFYNAFGLPVLVKDAYSEIIRYRYDAFNRLLELKGPYETDWTIKNIYDSNRKSITMHNLGQGNILHTSMLTDGLGRVIQVKKQLANDSNYEGCDNRSPILRLAVSGKNIYDEFGRAITNYLSEEELYCDSLPQGASLMSILTDYYRTTAPEEKKIFTKYDDLDRVLDQLVIGNNALTKNTYGFEGEFLTHKIELPEGNTSISYYNKFGQVIRQSQIGDGETLSTNFKYDPLGQLKNVTNALDHFTRYEYDLLGRQVRKNASATGTTNLEYDDLGQITRKRDANGNTINYIYDFNRLIQIDGFGINAYFQYDQGGRLAKMKDESGYQEFLYGKLGEVVEDTKMIYDSNNVKHYFKTKYKYDSWGRVLEIIYPDKERVNYKYNSVGQLISIQGNQGYSYLEDVKYNYFDQPYYIKYGNRVEMTQEFDLTERLRAAQLTTSFEDGNGIMSQSVFSRNAYAYDKNNNITSMYNNFSEHDQINIGGTYTKTYQYDAFNRLQHSNGSWDGLLEQHSYKLDMKYNKDHSIGNKTQSHTVLDKNTLQTHSSENSLDKRYVYEYGDEPKLSHIKGQDANGTEFWQNFSYAANGNIKEIRTSGNIEALRYVSRNFEWDANNNIIEILDESGIRNQYIYDGKGERVAKRLNGTNNININGGNPLNGMYGTEEVLYPSGNLTYNAKYYTKHYYANSKRIASRIVNSIDVDYFEDIDYNQEQLSQHSLPSQNLRLNNTNTSQSGYRTLGVPNTDRTICQNQINFLLNSLYNTPETLFCKQQLLQIIEEFTTYRLTCVEIVNNVCRRYERTIVDIDYCSALEAINARGCVSFTEDGFVIDPTTGYIYDPLTGIPYDPITRLPIDLVERNQENRIELDCYNNFLNFIDYYKDKDDKPEIYYELIKYYNCITCDVNVNDFKECYELKGVMIFDDESNEIKNLVKGGCGFYFVFCDLIIPPIEGENKEKDKPDFPEVKIPPGIDDTWQDEEPVSTPIVADPLSQDTPVWWYHSDHLGSSTYITDIFGKPCQYIEYLPFGEVMVEQSTNNIFENVYKFNGKELDESTGYYYYGARYYDPGASIFLSVDPLAEKYPGINPYTYVANNPINAIDPDGRDFRMITQRNSSGKIVNVSLHAVVYLQGSGASNEMATSLNSSFLNDYNNSRKVNGVTVSLNVTYVYDKNSVKNQKNLRGGENILKVRIDLPKSTSSFVEGSYNESKGIYRTGNTGEINSKSSNITRSTIHESMHFLGLSDRYDDFTGNHLNMGASKVTHPGFYDDIMGEGFNINDIHFENILNFSQENSNIKNSNSNGFEYSGNLKQLYDRASKRELYNGNKSNSSYHERSNQAN